MRLIGHLPPFLGEVIEFQEINKTLEVEVDAVGGEITQVQNNQFIETCNLAGVKRYEKMLNITPLGNLESRKVALLSKFTSSLPYTMGWLHNMLNGTVGQDYYILDLTDYTLNISIMSNKESLIPELAKDIRNRIPANIELSVNVLNAINVTSSNGVFIRCADSIKI